MKCLQETRRGGRGAGGVYSLEEMNTVSSLGSTCPWVGIMVSYLIFMCPIKGTLIKYHIYLPCSNTKWFDWFENSLPDEWAFHLHLYEEVSGMLPNYQTIMGIPLCKPSSESVPKQCKIIYYDFRCRHHKSIMTEFWGLMSILRIYY